MSKNYQSELSRITQSIQSDPIPTKEFTTSRGIKLTLKGIPPMLVQMATAGLVKPEPPTYEVSLEGGGVEVHTHDADSIAQSSDEEKAVWEKYRADLNSANLRATDILLTICIIEGVDLPEFDINSFAKRMKLMGITVPEDPEEVKILYCKTFVIGTQQDAELLIQSVMELTTVSPKEVDSAENSFRDQMES